MLHLPSPPTSAFDNSLASSPVLPAPHRALIWWTAAAFAAVTGYSRVAYGLLLPAIRADLGGSYGAYGYVNTANFTGYLLGALIVPLLLARLRRRIRIAILMLLLMDGAIAGTGLSLTLVQLGMWRFLVGFFSSVALVLTLALAVERMHPEERGRASGIVWMGGAFGVVISGLIAPLIVGTGSGVAWRLVWIVLGIAGVPVAIGLHRTLRAGDSLQSSISAPPHGATSALLDAPKHSPLRFVLAPRGFLLVTLAGVAYIIGYPIYLTFFVSLVVQQGLRLALVGLLWSAMGVAAAYGGIVWGRAIDRWPTGFTFAATFLLGAIGALTVLTGNIAAEVVGAALYGFSAFLSPALIATVLLRRNVGDTHYAATYGAFNTIIGTGQILGSLVGGAAVNRWGLARGIVTTSVLLMAATLFAIGYALMRPESPSSSP